MIAADEILLLPLRFGRRIATIIHSLDHQSRRRYKLHFFQFLLLIVVSRILRLTDPPARTISIQRNRDPVGIREALSGPLELGFTKPTRRTPRLPLDSC